MKAMATIALPEGLTPTQKEDGKVCVVVEGTMVDGNLEVSEIMAVEDYMGQKKSPKPEEKKPMPKGKKKRPARIAAILGDDEGMGY